MFCHFLYGVLVQVWYLIVSIPDYRLLLYALLTSSVISLLFTLGTPTISVESDLGYTRRDYFDQMVVVQWKPDALKNDLSAYLKTRSCDCSIFLQLRRMFKI